MHDSVTINCNDFQNSSDSGIGEDNLLIGFFNPKNGIAVYEKFCKVRFPQYLNEPYREEGYFDDIAAQAFVGEDYYGVLIRENVDFTVGEVLQMFLHPATIKDIAAYLEGFGYNATRKTISKDIEELIQIGIDIDRKREEHNLYFLDVRVFELAEVKPLVDAVQSSRFIPTKKSRAQIEKLSTFVGPHQSNIPKRQLYVDKRFKANNDLIFYIADNIHKGEGEKP